MIEGSAGIPAAAQRLFLGGQELLGKVGCADLSGDYVVDGIGGSVRFTQWGQEGISSEGWSYTVSGSTITATDAFDGDTYSGTVSGPPGSRTIVWSDGFTYTQQASSGFRDHDV